MTNCQLAIPFLPTPIMAPRKHDHENVLSQGDKFLANIAEKVASIDAKLRAKEQTASVDKALRTFVRIRPMLRPEVEETDEFQVANAVGGRVAVVSEPKFSVRGDVRPMHHASTLDGAFGPADTTEDVFAAVGIPLLRSALDGGTSTLMAYGQTGSGKTHTVTGLVRQLAEGLFEPSEQPEDEVNVVINVVEVHGTSVRDLVTGEDADIVEDYFGKVQLHKASKNVVSSAREMLNLVNRAMGARTTKSTGRNDDSSRSHAVIRIRLEFVHEDRIHLQPGELTIVDLAGSERNADQLHHDKAMMEESRLINQSLMTLSECITRRSQLGTAKGHVHIPFRQSKLTLLLKDSFELSPATIGNTSHRVFTIACLSPLARDANHSANTLRYAKNLYTCRQPDPAVIAQLQAKIADMDPITWPRLRIAKWIARETGGHVDPLNDPKCTLMADVKMCGRDVVALTREEFLAHTSATIGEKGAEMVYGKLANLCFTARSERRNMTSSTRRAPVPGTAV